MAKYDYLNNYLNPMTQYRGGGMLNKYDEGGTHEQNPNGGIPIGPNSTVEQGEASMNMTPDGTPTHEPTGSKYIFSDRQMWTPEEVKAAGLPPIRGAKTASAYMKRLNEKFKDRAGAKDAQLTLQEFNKRGQQLAESKRQAEQAKIQAAMQMNAQQAPEGLPTEVPPGMEEYQEQPPQMFMGGQFSRAEAGNLTGGATGIASTMPNARVNFNYGGMIRNYAHGGLFDPYTQVSSSSTGMPLDALGREIPGATSQIQGATAAATPSYGSLVSAVPQAIDLAMDVKGKNLSGNMGKDIGMTALKGGMTGAQIGGAIVPGLGHLIGAGAGIIAGGGIGAIGSNKADKRISNEQTMAVNQANAGMPNAQAWSAMGGYITSKHANYADGGIYIKPENRGKFTASAKAAGHGVQEHARMVVNNPDASETQRKRAQFAINAAKWSHADGGFLDGEIDWDKVKKGVEGGVSAASLIPGPIGYGASIVGSGIDAYDAYKAYQRGDKKEALKEAGMAGLGLIPFGSYAREGIVLGKGAAAIAGANKLKKLQNVGKAGKTLNSTLDLGDIIEVKSSKKAGGGYITRQPAAYANGGPFDGTLDDQLLTQNLAKAYQTGNPVNTQYGYDINPISNVQRTMGLTPGPWGPKSKAALSAYQANAGLKVDGSYGKDTFKAMGLTPGGRQYAESIQPMTQPSTFDISNVRPELLPNRPMAAPMSQQDMIDARWNQIGQGLGQAGSYLGNKASKYGKQAGQYLNDNAANFMRMSPVISNLMARNAITAPTGTSYARLNDAFNVPQVDEAARIGYADRIFNNQRRALGQMGGSQAQQRAALLGLGAQQTDLASKIAGEAADQNRQLALQKQQYQNAIAQYNAGASDRSLEAYRADLGNYETQRSKFTGQIGSDLGEIGKEQLRMKQVASMYGYTWDGKYMRDKAGKIVNLPGVTTDITSGTVTAPVTTTPVATVAYGGYIKRKPSKY